MADDILISLKKICSEIEVKCASLLKVDGKTDQLNGSRSVTTVIKEIEALNKKSTSLIKSKLPNDQSNDHDIAIESKMQDIDETQFDEMLNEISNETSFKRQSLKKNPQFSLLLDNAVKLTNQLYDKDGNFGTFSNEVGLISNRDNNDSKENLNGLKATSTEEENEGKDKGKDSKEEKAQTVVTDDKNEDKDKDKGKDQDEEKSVVAYEFPGLAKCKIDIQNAIIFDNLSQLKAILKSIPGKNEMSNIFEVNSSPIKECIEKNKMGALKILCDAEYNLKCLLFDKSFNQLYTKNGDVFSILYRYCYLNPSSISCQVIKLIAREKAKVKKDSKDLSEYYDWWFEVIIKSYNLMIEYNDFGDSSSSGRNGDIIDNNSLLDIFMVFLRVQSLGKFVPSHGNPPCYFVSYGNSLFKALLNLVFNENDLYQKLVKKHNNNGNNNKNNNDKYVIKSLDDINKIQGCGVGINGNYLLHLIIMCSASYFIEFSTFIKNKLKNSNSGNGSNSNNSSFTINCQLLNKNNESIFHIISTAQSFWDIADNVIVKIFPKTQENYEENFCQLYGTIGGYDSIFTKELLYSRSLRNGETILSNFIKNQRLYYFLNTPYLMPFFYSICKLDGKNMMYICGDNNSNNSNNSNNNNNNDRNSVFDQIISEIEISKFNDKDKEEPFIKHMLDNCENLLNEIVYYRNKNSGYNILSRIIDSKNMILIKYAFQKLFYFQDIGINGEKTKISTMLEYKIGKKLDCNCLMFGSWQNEKVSSFVKSVYNASKNNEIATLRSVLDLIVLNQQRAIEKLNQVTQQRQFSLLFIDKLCTFVFLF